MHSLTPAPFLRLSRHPLPHSALRVILLVALILVNGGVHMLLAQQNGWGDTWTQTRSDREHERRDALRQVAQAVKAKKYAEAESQLDALIRRSPENVELRMIRAAAHTAMHRYDAALQDCAQGIALLQTQEPGAVGVLYNYRAEIYRAMGKPAECRADLERAVRVDKTNGKFNNDLAWLLATSPDRTVRDGQLALRYAQAASRLSGRHDFAVLDTLAAAEAEAGQFDQAAKDEREALALAKGKKVEGGEKRLSLYIEHQPYREIVHENIDQR